jgi:hypothetical protein
MPLHVRFDSLEATNRPYLRFLGELGFLTFAPPIRYSNAIRERFIFPQNSVFPSASPCPRVSWTPSPSYATTMNLSPLPVLQ